MKKPHMPDIRELLRAHPDGMTAEQLHRALPHITKVTTIRKCLERMPDVYIDRWTKTRNCRGQFLAVWCAIVPPANCPYPTDRFDKPKTLWVNTGAQA